MIKLEIKGNKQQTITKVCNKCGAHMQDLAISDIVINNTKNTITPKNNDGTNITRTELPENLKVSKCENCS